MFFLLDTYSKDNPFVKHFNRDEARMIRILNILSHLYTFNERDENGTTVLHYACNTVDLKPLVAGACITLGNV